MNHRQKIRTWTRYKQLITDLGTASIPFIKYQMDDYCSWYQLALVTDSYCFTIALEKGLADAIDYEASHQSTFIICNESTD